MKEKSSISRKLISYLNLLLRIALIALIVILLHAIYKGLKQDGYMVQAIQTPKSFTDSGLSGFVIANKIQDRVASLKAKANSSREDSLTISANTSSDLKMDVMGIGVSSTSLIYHLRDLLNIETKTIRGHLIDLDQELTMTVRVHDFPSKELSQSYKDQGVADAFDLLLTNVAEHVLSCIDPYYHAVNLYKSKRYDEAHAMIREMITNRPGEEKWAYVAWGNMMNGQNDRLKAAEYYLKAVEIDDKFYLANNNLGWYYFREEDYEKAINHFEKATSEAPVDSENLHGIALCYQRLGQTDKAESYYKQNVEQHPSNIWSYMVYADFFTSIKKDTSSAIEIFKNAKNSVTVNDEYYLTQAGFYFFQNKLDSALIFVNKSLDFNPNNIGALQQITGYMLSSENQKYEEAIPYLKRLVGLVEKEGSNKDRIMTFNNRLAIAEWNVGQYDSAFVHIQNAIDVEPSFALPYTTLAEIHYAKGDKHSFYKVMQKAFDLGLEFPERWFEDEPYKSLKNDPRLLAMIQKSKQKKEQLKN